MDRSCPDGDVTDDTRTTVATAATWRTLMIMTILLSSERIDRARSVEAGHAPGPRPLDRTPPLLASGLCPTIADRLLRVAPPPNECTVQPAAHHVYRTLSRILSTSECCVRVDAAVHGRGRERTPGNAPSPSILVVGDVVGRPRGV